MENGMVSIISPCFNGASYISRFLDSVLQQDYPSIQLIVINDGSTDNTLEIMEDYRRRFEEKGIEYQIVSKENTGISDSLNHAFALCKGKYLMWPDSDDEMLKNHVSVKVQYFEDHPSVDLVISQGYMVDEFSQKVIGSLQRVQSDPDNLFMDLLFEKNVYFAPIGYMVRFCAFLELFPSKKILEHKSGQNWQILLPFARNKKYGYIDEHLFNYYIRDNSHSRREKTYADIILKYHNHEDLLRNTIMSMNLPDETELLTLLDLKYASKRFELASMSGSMNDVVATYSYLIQKGVDTFHNRMIYLKRTKKLLKPIIQLFYLLPKSMYNRLSK